MTLVKSGERAAVVPIVTGNGAEVAYDGDFSMWLTPYEYETAEIRLYLPPFIYQRHGCAARARAGRIFMCAARRLAACR